MLGFEHVLKHIGKLRLHIHFSQIDQQFRIEQLIVFVEFPGNVRHSEHNLDNEVVQHILTLLDTPAPATSLVP